MGNGTPEQWNSLFNIIVAFLVLSAVLYAAAVFGLAWLVSWMISLLPELDMYSMVGFLIKACVVCGVVGWLLVWACGRLSSLTNAPGAKPKKKKGHQ